MFIVISLISLSAQSQSASEFDSFFTRFKAAVMRIDTNRLQDLIAHDFEYLGAINVTPSDVFADLGVSDEWSNLQSAVQTNVLRVSTYEGKPARFLQCTPPTKINNCYVIFQTDASGRWLWKAMIMPPK